MFPVYVGVTYSARIAHPAERSSDGSDGLTAPMSYMVSNGRFVASLLRSFWEVESLPDTVRANV